MKITADISGFQKKIASMRTKFKKIGRWLQNTLQRMQIQMQAIAPVKTGKLQASIQGKLFSMAGSEIRGTIGSNVHYASFHKQRLQWDQKTGQLDGQIRKFLSTIKA